MPKGQKREVIKHFNKRFTQECRRFPEVNSLTNLSNCQNLENNQIPRILRVHKNIKSVKREIQKKLLCSTRIKDQKLPTQPNQYFSHTEETHGNKQLKHILKIVLVQRVKRHNMFSSLKKICCFFQYNLTNFLLTILFILFYTVYYVLTVFESTTGMHLLRSFVVILIND